MRVDTAAFAAKNTQIAKRPRYTIEVAFDSASSILWYFTSHTDAATPPGASVISNVIEGLSGTSQKLDPDKAIATIGSISFNVVDRAGTVTSTLGSQLALGRSTRRQRVRVYVGYEGLAWADYALVQTQLVTTIEWKEGAYQFICMDVQRQLRKDIFELAKTQLAASIDENATTIDVVSTAAFSMVQHGTSYTDAPSSTVGYLQINDERIRYTGKTSTQFTGCTRGALNTRPASHNADLTVSADQRTPVEEYVYLEMPAVKLMYALLTGTLYNQGGATLPTTWHMGVDPAFVQLSDFTSKLDLYDPADDTKGFPVRFEDLGKQDGKAFLEKELALLLGTYMPIYASGALGLRKMASVLAGAAYTQLLNESNLVSCTQLKHDFESLHNILQVSWNWEPLLKAFTRVNILADGSSITVHGKSDPLNLEFRGLAGSIHSSTMLAKRFDALRDRYSGPPLRISVTVVPSLNALEIGDVVRVKLAKVRDFVANSSLDRSFEIQNIRMDWVTGNDVLDLFASSQAASAQAPSTDATAISDAWYTSAGTNLATVLTITGSNPGHVSANGAVAGATDMNAAGSIFYYNGDLQIDNGVTVTLTGNVQLRIKGFLQNNGTISGKGGGIAGAAQVGSVTSSTSATPGTPGFIGTTEAGGGFSTVRINVGFTGGGNFISRNYSTRGLVVSGQYQVSPPIELKWTGAALQGIPSEMRGTSGSSGGAFYPDPSTLWSNEKGGAGGASGAGLCIVSRGFSLGASAKIDLSGGDGAQGDTFNPGSGPYSGIVHRAGSGAGGAPGALIVLLDGANQTATGISEVSFVALQGKTPIMPLVMDTPTAYEPISTAPLSSFYVGSGDGSTFPLASMSGTRGASRVQFVPANTTNTADASPTELTPPTDLKLIARAYAVLGGGFQTRIEATWTSSGDPLVAGYDLQYKKSVNSAWIAAPSVVGRTASSAVVASGIQPGIDYDVRMRSAGSLRQVSENWVPVYNFYAAATIVSGLQLDPNNRAAFDIFTGPDAVLIWRADGQQSSFDIGSEPYGAGSGSIDTYQKDYLVRVLNANGTVRREEVLTGITTPTYTYTLDKNIFDGAGTPVRAFTIKMYRRDDANQVSPIAATLDISNPQAGQPAAISLRATFNQLIIDWTSPGDADLAGIIINVSTSNGFTQSGVVAGSGNCRYAGPDRLVVIDNVVAGTTYYVKAACYDTFGTDALSYTTQLQVTTAQVQTPDLGNAAVTISKIKARRIELSGDVWTDNSPTAGKVAWSALSLAFDGTVYAVGASNTVNKWIYWDFANPTVLASSASFPALTDTQFLVAVNNGGVHDLVWNANGIGTKIIDTVMIGDAVVGNAQISDLNATKINAGDIAAARMETNFLTAAQATVGQLDAITATIGLLRTATSGARLEVASNVIRVYDSGGTLRVKIGDLS